MSGSQNARVVGTPSSTRLRDMVSSGVITLLRQMKITDTTTGRTSSTGLRR
jgi:hypothetical protein